MTATGFPTTRPAVRPEGRRSGGPIWRLVLGRVDSPRWERPALIAELLATAVLYIAGLGVNGWSNAFYSAAVQAGSTNWEAFFYGSSDAGNSITVDKPPAFLWVMDISVRLFGLNSWAILVPEAIMGVITVALVYAIVRRRFSAGAALIAAGVVASTPVATLMFRFNNPDALLVLLMTLSVYLVLRGIETGRMRWIVWAGVAVGFAFLTKQLQGFLILPALVGVYLYASPVRFGRRLLHLLAAAAAIVVSAGWWVAIVQLVPAGSRPYVGGSQDDSFLSLTFGYNGLGRVTGDETGSVTGGGGAGGGAAGGTAAGGGFGRWGATGLTRLFGSEFNTQITWLLPAALLLLVVVLVMLGFRHRIDGRRATVLLLGGSLVVTALVFSFMGGIFHPYYTIALAPYIGGLVGIGAAMVWQRREVVWVRIAGAFVLLLTGVWAWVLLAQASDWQPWIKWVVGVCAVGAAALLLLPYRGRAIAAFAVSASVVTGLLGPVAMSVETAATAHTGSLPSAGPTIAGAGFGGGRGGFGGGGGAGRFGGGFGGGGAGGGFGGGGGGRGGFAGAPGAGGGGGTAAGGGGTGTGTGTGGFGGRGGFGGGRGGGGAGLLGGSTTVNSALTKLLDADASKYTWVAAAIGSNNAASYQLAVQHAVMPIGGFNGSDPSPTLAEFKADVAAGKIHYFIGGSLGRSNGGSNVSSKISAWVAANFTAKTVGGVTVYDLTSGS
jgi:4-amino-4-deoxy-L-arabinose transferase-like glycosyltransferase